MKTQIVIEFEPEKDQTWEVYRKAAIVALATRTDVQVRRSGDTGPPILPSEVVKSFNLLRFAMNPHLYHCTQRLPSELLAGRAETDFANQKILGTEQEDLYLRSTCRYNASVPQ